MKMQRGSANSLLITGSVRSVDMRSVGQRMSESPLGLCMLDTVKSRLPIVKWLPKYKLDLLIQDLIAGISVGLTAIPQGIAYAGVAGLPLQYGLYSGFMGCFVYLILGSCKDLTIGPTAILALMTQKYVADYGPDFAVLLTFLSGCLIFLFGLFHLGFLIEFISMPVTTGFTTAAAVTIAFTQLHSLLGFKGRSDTFLEVWINFIKNFRTVKLWDSVLGVSTIIILLLLRELRKVGSRTTRPGMSVAKSLFYKFNWLVSLARNALVVIAGCLLAWGLKQHGLTPFTLTGEVEKGLPPFRPPPFSTSMGNTTYTFLEMVQELNTSILTIALISILEAVAIAKAFSNGKMVDATQEMFALGVCNILGSFVSSMPTTGSFTRTVVNHSSGVQTTMGGVFTGALVLMSLGFLTSAFQYIPKAVLAGLIISAMIFMMEFEVIVMLWKSRKIELLPFLITLLCCLFIGLEVGILIGIIVNVVMVLATIARPEIPVDLVRVHDQDVITVSPTSSLLYCSADHFSRSVMAVALTKQQQSNADIVVIIDGSNMKIIDVTVAKNMKVIVESLRSRQQKVFLWRFHAGAQAVLLGVYPAAQDMFTQQQELQEIVKYAGTKPLEDVIATE